ncbi:MAG TPA: sigma-70 family RNA polymerase sigma factor [Candidatus Polarisedimenticolaceae bacterium]|nr:sigma-70 family RNA polymerase sigma factor [Candidatus Polarisedimenticolaceae bacterium]
MSGTTAPTFVPELLAPGKRGPKPKARRKDIPRAEMERLIEEARRLVPICARAYMGRGVPIDDLVGAGNLGVVEGAYRFDPGRGVKFASYAMWWIRRGMSAAIERESQLVIVPRYSRDRRRRVLEILSKTRDDDGPQSLASVGAELGLTEHQVERAMNSWSVMLSLDTPTRPESKRTLGDTLTAPDAAEPDEVTLSAEMWRRIGDAIAALPKRQRTVLKLRYGLSGKEPALLSDISALLGLSRERVRQIENEALAQVRRSLTRERRSSSSPTRS